MTESDVRVMVEAIGKVQSCNLVMDSKTAQSKGFAFVEVPKPGEAKAVIKTLNGQTKDGMKIRVKKAEDRPATPEKPDPWAQAGKKKSPGNE